MQTISCLSAIDIDRPYAYANELVTQITTEQASNSTGIQAIAKWHDSGHGPIKGEDALAWPRFKLMAGIERDVPGVAGQEV